MTGAQSPNSRKLLTVLEIRFADRDRAERCLSDMDDFFNAIILEAEKLADNAFMPTEVKAMCVEAGKDLIGRVFSDRQN